MESQTSRSGPVKIFDLFLFFSRRKRWLFFSSIVFAIFSAVAESIGIFLFFPLLSDGAGAASNLVSVRFNQPLRVLIGSFQYIFYFFSHKVVTLITIGFVFSLRGIAKFFEVKCRINFVVSQLFDYRQKLTKSFSRLNFKFFNSKSKSELAATLGGDFDQARASCDYFFNFLTSASSSLVYFCFALLSNFWASVFAISLGCIAGWILRTITKKISVSAKALLIRSAEYNTLTLKALESYKYLRATNRYEKIEVTQLMKDQQIELAHRTRGKFEALLQSIQQPTTALLLILTITFDSSVLGNPTSKSLITLVLIYRFVNSVMSSISAWQTFSSQIGVFEKIMKNVNEFEKHPEILEQPEGLTKLESIELRNISLYVDQRTLIKNINFKISNNKAIGIVGHSGAGKTTLFDILVGVQSPSTGELFINGQASDASHLRGVRTKFGMVTQDPILFNATVIENITLDFKNFDEENSERDEKIIYALKLSGAWSFVNHFPNLLKTKVGETHFPLSGGQRQMLAIAREIFLGSEILFLDEASSALDADAEENLLHSLTKLKEQVGLVIISHRPRLLKHCDEIIVLNRGSIIRRLDSWEIVNLVESDWVSLVKDEESRSGGGGRRIYAEGNFLAYVKFDGMAGIPPFKVLNLSKEGIGIQQPKGHLPIGTGKLVKGIFQYENQSFPFEGRIIHERMSTVGIHVTLQNKDLEELFGLLSIKSA